MNPKSENGNASPSYCPSKPAENVDGGSTRPNAEDISRPLDPSAQAFLDHLGLPLVHPHCTDERNSRHEQYEGIFSTHDELSTVGKGVFEVPFASEMLNNTHGQPALRSAKKSSLSASELVPPPIIGPISLMELHDGSAYELFLTATTMAAPTLAMAELWLRLISFFLSPLCLAILIHREMRFWSTAEKKKRDKRNISNTRRESNIQRKQSDENIIIATCVLGLASSAVLFTDSLYVYEYGRWFGISLFALSTILATRAGATIGNYENDSVDFGSGNKGKGILVTMKKKKTIFHGTIFSLILTTVIVLLRSDGGHFMDAALDNLWSKIFTKTYEVNANNDIIDTKFQKQAHNPLTTLLNPGIDIPTIEPGLYFSSGNPLVSSIASHWPESSRTYTVESGATPYLVNGDQRTGIPFLIHKVEEQEYVRNWVRNPFDGEILALDIAFPLSTPGDLDRDNVVEDTRTFVHNSDQPVYLVLHGLNGGSHEEYVKDFVNRRRAEGSTVVVLIARGMMDTHISNGWNVFHGARTGDVDIAARALRKGLDSLAQSQKIPNRQVLAGVGYSMGGIILSNYVARSGQHCALDAAMAVSGGLDMRQNLNFKRSMRLWQPMLTFGLREDILLGKYARHYKHRLTKEQFVNMLRVTSISHLDVEAIVNYNSFDNLVHYYSEMSAMGDRNPEFQLFASSLNNDAKMADETPLQNTSSWGRIGDVAIPFAVLQALDDPLVGWRTIGTDNPQELANSGSGNVMLLLTKAGGHVGWPLGSNPKRNGWKWMNDAARDFVTAVDLARRDLRESQ